MAVTLQSIGEHIQYVTGIPYAVYAVDQDGPDVCLMPSCSLCKNCPLKTKVYAYTHQHSIQDAMHHGGKQIYTCMMGFIFVAFVPKARQTQKQALILGPIVPGEVHDGLYQSFSPELDRALSRSNHMTTLQIRSLVELVDLCLKAGAKHGADNPPPMNFAVENDTERIRRKYSVYLRKRDGFILSGIERLRELVETNERRGLEKCLTELINRLYIENSEDLNVFKARALQLIDLFVRMMIDQGLDVSETLANSSDLLRHLDILDSADTLCVWLQNAMLQMSVMALQGYHIVYRDAVSKAIQYLRANWDKKLTLDDIAENTYLSKAYLCTVFKREMGMSILEYLNRFRVEKAKELLAVTNIPLAEIAEQCCFFDQSYFSKVFRRYTGFTPRSWREGKAERTEALV